jgi:hypothetical protein
VAFLRGFSDRLKKWAPEMHRANPEIPPDKAMFYLQSLFQIYLQRTPQMFLDGYYLEPLYQLMF